MSVAVLGTQATVTIPGGAASGKHDPDVAPATTPAIVDEFDDASLTVWAWDSAPATADEATYPGSCASTAIRPSGT